MSDVRDFGAAGDGKTDDTEAVRHALSDGDGVLEFPPGEYLLKETIHVDLSKRRRFGVVGLGGTPKLKAAMKGAAFHIVGTHDKNADPSTFRPVVWEKERMPTFSNFEIEGAHPEASGFLMEGVMQPTFEGVLLRDLLHGIRLFKRARNVLISHCHIYNLKGVGVWFDQLNLHQGILVGTHLSYCKRGGLRIEGSEIRNLHVTGCDIEYNYDLQEKESADVWIDSRGPGATVREATFSGCTIQAKYSPGGANVRILGGGLAESHKAGMISITGNVIGSQERNIHLVGCRGVVVSGNVIYSGHLRNVHAEGCRNLVLSGNSFDHNPDYGPKELCTGVRIENSRDVLFAASQIHDCQSGKHTVDTPAALVREALLEISHSQRVQVQGCQLLDAAPYAIHADSCDQTLISGCTLVDARKEPKMAAPIKFVGAGSGNFVSGCLWNKGAGNGELAVEAPAQVVQSGNQTV